MPGNGTRRSAKKSRAGCTRCKTQHIKCDEKRPACGRCERLGIKCPGYSQQFKWSTKHEVNQWTTPPPDAEANIDSLDWLEFVIPPSTSSLLDSVAESSTAPADSLAVTNNELQLANIWESTDAALVGHQPELDDLQLLGLRNKDISQQPMLRSLGVRRSEAVPHIESPLTHQPYELINYYFQVVACIYSAFDNHKNPFRSAVSNLYSHSLAVNLAAQSMAAAYLAEIHPRFATIGKKLRLECLEIIQADTNHSYDILLAMMMSAPTGNWHDVNDLGVTHYNAMRDRLQVLASAGRLDTDFYFFQEAMILWELFLTYTTDSSELRPSLNIPSPVRHHLAKREPHPWTGVGRDTMQTVADIGRLVRSNRRQSRGNKFVTQAYIQQMSQDLASARVLEQRLLAAEHPEDKDVANTEDSSTPIWHITTLAELYRYAGLLQLYRVFPDLLSERLRVEALARDEFLTELADSPFPALKQEHDEWLTNFATEALRLLQKIPMDSGTKDFHLFLLVMLGSELGCGMRPNAQQSLDLPNIYDSEINTTFVDVAMTRKFVLDQLTSYFRLIPPKPVRVCLDIVKEVWKQTDSGICNVYWLDVMIENGWETIMA